MLPSKSHFNQLLGHYGCDVVRSISSNLEDTLDATFQQPFESISSTLWMLRCNIQFEQLGRSLGCYVPTAISINFQDTMHATVHHCYVVTSISSNFEDALDVTFQETFQSTSRTLWMLRCTIQFEQLGRRLGCYVPTAISINFQDTLMLRCTIPTL